MNDYDVMIIRLEDDDGDVIYKAYSPDLDSHVYYGSGETKVEALESFEETLSYLLDTDKEEGKNTPAPKQRNLIGEIIGER